MARSLLGRPLYWTGAYLVDGLLLDCGPPAAAHELLRFLEGRRLEGLVLTHHHEDHVGAAAALARRGLVPRIHAAGVRPLNHGFPVQPYRRLVWGMPARVAAEPLGTEVRTRALSLEVIHTPGHSPDHVCLFEPQRGWLFTGDLFLGERLRYLRRDEDLGALIASLRAVADRPARQVFCAHRGVVHDGPGALRRKLQLLEELRGRILDLLGRGLAQKEIARRLLGPEGPITWLSLGHFSARNFVRAVARASQPDA